MKAAAVFGAMLSALLFSDGPLEAQDAYPTRPVRIVVPSEAGGGTDTIARALADGLSQSMGRQFVVENRPGAAQMLGIEAVARAPADGYTLLVAASPITINPAINKDVRYDVLRDFAPVTQLISVPSILVVHPKLPVETLGAFIEAARKSPGALNYGSAGTGTQPHMAMELLKATAQIDVQHIPYKGVAPALTDVISGRIAAMFVNMISAKQHVERGTLRALANSSVNRSPAMPQVPTVAEAGVPGYEAMQWFGLFAPAGTAREIITSLNEAAAKALRADPLQKRLQTDGADAVTNSPAAFAEQIRDELKKWERVAKAARLP